METPLYSLLLADDDTDDCMLFKEALEELPLKADLKTVHSGMELMHALASSPGNLPHALFIDLNMPGKTGFECLSEIKNDEKTRKLPIIIHSTSFDLETVSQLYNSGAHYYIRKPGEFSLLKKVLYKAVIMTAKESSLQPPMDKFVIRP